MRLTAVLASALFRPALVLTWVCSSRRWLGTASCRPRYNPGMSLASVQGSTVHGSAILVTSRLWGGGGVSKGSSKSGSDGGRDQVRGRVQPEFGGYWDKVGGGSNGGGEGGGRVCDGCCTRGEHVSHATGQVVRATEWEAHAEGCAEK